MKPAHLLHKGKRARQRRREGKGGDCMIRGKFGRRRVQ